MNGFIHIYCGDGKGKTTSSVGLAIRAVGNQIPVVFAQFMKDASSGEVSILKNLPNIKVIHSKKSFGFYNTLSEEDKKEAKHLNTKLLEEAIRIGTDMTLRNIQDKSKIASLLILDESIGTYNYDLLDKSMLLDFLKAKPDNLEVVLTGRNPSDELMELADYISEIKHVKHPFDKGIGGRLGIEK